MREHRTMRKLTSVFIALATIACGDEAQEPTVPARDPPAKPQSLVPRELRIISPGMLDPGVAVELQLVAYGAQGTQVPAPPVAWSSSDTVVLTVDSTGLATPHAPGVAQVMARFSDALLATVDVVVLAQPWIARLSFEHDSVLFVLPIGDSVELPLKAHGRWGPVDATEITFATTEPSVATVDAEGRVRAHSTGYALITATAPSGAVGDIVVDVPLEGEAPFRISVTFDASIADDRRRAFVLAAVHRWERMFTAPLAPVALSGRIEVDCPNLRDITPAVTVPAGVETGLRLIAFASPIVLGGGVGGPCRVRQDGTAVVGYIGLRPELFPADAPDALGVELALHELAHALGLAGTLGAAHRSPWNDRGETWWHGQMGREGYALEFGSFPDSIMIFQSHWHDPALRSDTTVDAIAQGPVLTRRRITKVSLGALRDIGYPTAFHRAELVAPDPCPACVAYFPGGQ